MLLLERANLVSKIGPFSLEIVELVGFGPEGDHVSNRESEQESGLVCLLLKRRLCLLDRGLFVHQTAPLVLESVISGCSMAAADRNGT